VNLLYVRKQIDEPWWKRWPKYIRDWYCFHHREGFFRASLNTVANVKNISVGTLRNISVEKLTKYDGIVLHFRCNYLGPGSAFETLREVLQEQRRKLSKIPNFLLLTKASAEVIPDDNILDHFQLIFKREPFKDLDRYDLTTTNKEKINPTILSCPLVPATYLNHRSIKATDYGFETPSRSYEHDVFFSGKRTSEQREKIVRFLVNSSANFHGGLQEKHKSLPDPLLFPRLSRKRFHHLTRKSKINLALEGFGQFTYRHWELWALSSFLLSPASINDLWLPFEAIDGQHYATFDGEEDLQKKINYYAQNSEERNKIAREGRKLFEENYDFVKHGNQIEKAINGRI
jgi:glycosyltransferase involved in cell wall biosynthesis